MQQTNTENSRESKRYKKPYKTLAINKNIARYKLFFMAAKNSVPYKTTHGTEAHNHLYASVSLIGQSVPSGLPFVMS